MDNCGLVVAGAADMFPVFQFVALRISGGGPNRVASRGHSNPLSVPPEGNAAYLAGKTFYKADEIGYLSVSCSRARTRSARLIHA
jgi:hypothetical protein